jgi:C4-dicarboxylate-specific signal transduction histidine kinase
VDEFVVVPMVVADQRAVCSWPTTATRAMRSPTRTSACSRCFAQHAGLAVESAIAYEEIQRGRRELEHAYMSLQQTQGELVRAEQLAAIGEMAARIAHDLRNPLVTIGGWARDIVEEPMMPA